MRTALLTLKRDENSDVIVPNPRLEESFRYNAIHQSRFINNAVERLVLRARNRLSTGHSKRLGGSSHSHGMLLPRHGRLW
jgi:hypothetical protein